MIALVFIGIVAAMVVPNVIGRPDQARVTVATTDLRTIAARQEMYRLDNRTCPGAAQGLTALAAPPVEPPLPPNRVRGGYLPPVPADSGGNAYVYRSPGEGAAFDLVPLGADGVTGGSGTDADIRLGAGIAQSGTGGVGG